MNKTLLLAAIYFLLIFSGCEVNKNSTFINENIPEDIKNTVSEIDNKVIEAIKANDYDSFKSKLSDKLKEQKGDANIRSLFNKVSMLLKDKGFKYKDQFYVVNKDKNVSNTIFSGFSADNDYIVNYRALNNKMFISLLLPQNVEDEFLITFIYGLYGNEWKLNIFHFGSYSIHKQTAIDYYKAARYNYEKGYLINATNSLSFGQQCLKPGGEFIQYVKEKDFRELQEKVISEINKTYIFPIVVEKVKTKPQIFNVQHLRLEDGNFPMVRYCTTVNLKDTVSLKKENEEIQKVIGEIFTGIDKNNKYILYRALNEIPDGTYKRREQYGFVQKIDVK